MNPKGDATLHKKGGGTLLDRWVAAGTLANMLKRFMQEGPIARRELLLVHEDMEYQPAEIQSLAGQYVFSPAARMESRPDALLARTLRARRKR
jgi:hypothetical protein